GYNRIREEVRKFAVPTGDRFNPNPLPIKKIYVLCPEKRSDITIVDQSGLERFNALKNQIYKRRFVRFMGNQEAYFKTLGQVSNHIPLARVYRPRTPFLLNELADILEKDFLK
ncbi:MAG: hypothetical protein GY940_07930, partial [bacterium]|nr:hypothetical protein [bacterium]